MMRTLLLLLVSSIVSLTSFAQVLSITDNSPTESFINEEFCYTDDVSNLGVGTPGYGPYFRVEVPANVTLNSASFLGGALSLNNLGVSTGAAIADPNLNTGTPVDSILAPVGSTVYIVQLPVGSIVDGGPQMNIEWCWTISLAATVGVAESIDITPVYQFGDTPTGSNGPIIFPVVTESVIPLAYVLTKASNNFEQEASPGQCTPIEYILTVDIANGVTLNNLVISDVLPAELQFVSILSNGGCAETTVPSTITPGGNLVITCPSTTGTLGSSDVEIVYESYVIDYLDETICESQELFNAASVSTSSFPSQTAADTSLIQHAIIEHANNAGGAVTIGQTVVYTITTEVSEYTAGLNAYTVQFVVPDGMIYNAASLTWGGAPLNPLNVTEVPGPGTGSTVTVDLFAENAGNLLPCIVDAISYTADVNETYFNGDNVLSRDGLNNTSSATYGLAEGASGCVNTSASGISVIDIALSKNINNSPPTGPGRNGEWIPGDIVQYQIELNVPSLDLDNVIITDFFPIPIHDVTTLAPAFGTDVVFDPSSSWTTPPIGYTIDPVTNSLQLDFGDLSNTVTGGSVDIVLNIDIIISTAPYANGLFHANFATSLTDNTDFDNLVGTQGTIFLVGAPALTLEKNVVSSDNGSASIDVDGNITGVDALDTVRFEIVTTNVGDAQAYDVVISDVVPTGMSSCALETTDPVTLIGGDPLTFTGGFTGNNLSIALDDTISFAGDPGADAAVVSYYCIVNPGTVPAFTLTNAAQAIWAQTPMGVPFAPVTDEAMVTAGNPSVNKDLDSTFPSNLSGNDVTIGDFVQYEVVVEIPEGQMDNVIFRDQLDAGLAFIQIESITASSPDVASSLGGFAGLIGTEVVSPVGGGPDNIDRTFDLGLGTITNTNVDNTTTETITIVYTTSVLNIASNVRGANRNNQFAIIWDNPNSAGTLNEDDSAPNVTIVEPELELTKGYLDNSLVPGNETFVTLAVDHSGASDATAYDVTLVDTLPLGMNYIAGFDNLSGAFSATPTVNVIGNIITISMDSITVAQDITYSFRVQLDPAYPICDSVINCSYVRWESLYAPTQVGLPTGINNEFVGERTGDTSDIGSINNIYVVQSCAPLFSTNEPTDPTILSSPQVCEGGEVTLSVNAYTGSVVEYNWSGPGIPSGVNSNVVVIDPVTIADTGNYTIIVNVDGCVSDTSQAFNLQVYENPTVAPTNNGTLCMDPAIDLQLTSNGAGGTTPYTYNWTGPNSFSSISVNPIIANPNASNSGDYNVILTDNNGCTAIGNTLVSISDRPNQPVVSSNTPVCEGENLTISTQTYSGSSVTYSWTGPSGPISNNSNILNLSPASVADAGQYTVFVTVDGCASETTTHTVEVHPNPAPLISASSSPVCGQDTLFLFANNSTGSTYTFNWSGPNGFSSTLENPFIANATSVNNGFYNLTVSDSNSCSANSSVQATVLNALAVPTVSSANTNSCVGDAVTLSVTPTYSGTTVNYNWSTPTGPVVTTVPELIINPATAADAGSYFLTSVEVDGCSSQASNTVIITITDNTTAPNTTVDNATVCEGDFFNLSTSTVADSYSWTGPNGFTSNSATPAAIEGSALTAGTYNLVVTTNGCVSPVASETVTVNPSPAPPTITGTTSICEGDAIVLSTSSTCDNFLWIGPGGSSTTTLTNPLLNTTTNSTTIPFGDAAYASGNWSVVCVSADGCESEASAPISITINPIPVAIANNDGPICENGDVTLIGNTQTGATYEWYDEFYTTLLATSTNHVITGLTNGTYTFNYVVTSNGCADTATTVVTVSTVLAPPTINANNTTLCEGDLLLLSTPTNADTYNWTGPNGFTSQSQVPSAITASSATAGTYNLDVTIAGCGSATASTTITVNALPDTPILTLSNSVCDGDAITLSTVDVASNYYWVAPSGDTVITAVDNLTVSSTDPNYGSGAWSLFVENANGCFSAASNAENVTVNPLPVALANNNGPICANGDATLTGNSQAGATYEWYDEFYTTLLSTATTHTEANLATGTYTFNYIMNVNGCVDTATTIVTVDPALAAPIALVDNPTVCEDDFFSLSTSTVADSYSWTGPNGFTSTSASPTAIQGSALTAGTYNLVVTTNGCVSPVASETVTVNPSPAPPTITGTTSICEGDAIVLSTSSTCDNFLWIGPGGSSTTTLTNPLLNTTTNSTTIPFGDAAYASGNWSVVCISADGCESEASAPISITINPIPVALANNNGPICANGDVTLTGNSQAGATYEWYDEFYTTLLSTATTHTEANLATGTYTFNYIINVNGCVDTATTVVTVDPALAAPIALVDNPTVCEDDFFSLSTSTVADSYSWTGPNGFTSTSATPTAIQGSALTAGTYSLVVTTNGCVSPIGTVAVVVNPAPAAPSITGTTSICEGDAIVLSTSSTCDNFLWIGPGGSSTTTLTNPLLNTTTNSTTIPFGDAAYASGNWSVVCISADGCESEASAPISITINPIPVAIANNDGPICENGDVTLIGNTQTGATYEWYDEFYTTLLATSTNHVITGLTNGTYTFNYVVTSNGCADTATTVVTVSTVLAPPTINANNTTLCEGDLLLLSSPTNADTYNWTGPNGFTSQSQVPSAITASSATAGIYNLDVTIAGCGSATASTTITVNALPDTPILTLSNSVCDGDDITLSTVDVATNYYWIAPSGDTVTTAVDNLTVNSTGPNYGSGAWSLFVENTNGCFSATSNPESVTVNPLPVALANNNGPICANGDATLTGNSQAGATYEWYDEFYTTLLSTATTHIEANLAAGTYTFNYIMNVNGCVDTATTVVTVDPALAAPITLVDNATVCEGDFFNLSTSTVADSYSWTGPNGFTSNSATPTAIQGSALTAGTYDLVVTTNGCTSLVGSVSVTVNALPDAPVLSASSSVCDGDDITLSTVDVATNYYWIAPSGDTVTTAVDNLTVSSTDPNYGSGAWSLFVENANGCFSATSNAENVTVNPLPVALANNNGPICANGDATLTGNSQAGATYEWYDEFYTTLLSTATTHIEANLATGTYTFNYIMNVNGCVDTATTIVTVDPALAAPIALVDNATVCEDDFFNLSTSTVADSYSWTGPNGFTSNSATPTAIQGSALTAGTYDLVVTTNGCTSLVGSVSVTVNALPDTPILTLSNSVCDGDDITLSTVDVATNYYWIAPSGDTVTTAVDNLTVSSTDPNYGSGAWSLFVENANGCFSAASNAENVTVNPLPVALANNNGPICANGDATLTGNSQAGATYEWYDEFYTTLLSTATTHTETNLATGTYTFNYIMNVNGCVDTATTIVTVDPALAAPIALVDNAIVCEDDFFNLSTSTVADGYSWTGPNGFTSTSATPTAIQGSALTAGTYNLVVTTNGCTSLVGSVSVTVNALPDAPVLSASNSVCDGDAITLSTVDVATNYYWVAPSGDTVTTAVDNLTVSSTDPNYESGAWSLFVENANGCFSAVSNAENVTVNPLPVALANNNGPICANGDATLTGNSQAGATYEWYDEFYTTLLSTATTHTETNLATGTYTFNYIMNVNGCVDTATTIVTVDPALTAPTALVDNAIVCEDDFFNLSTSTVADSYSWTGPNGFTSTSATPTAIQGSALTAGTYDLVVTTNGCTSLVGSVSVTVNPSPAAPTITGTMTICEGEDLVLSTSATCDNFLWIGPGGSSTTTLMNPFLNTSTNTTTIPATDTAYAGGLWSVICVSPEGCESDPSLPITITINAFPDTAIASSNAPVCLGDDILLTANTVSGATYTWTGTNGYFSTDQNPVIANAQLSDAADYSVTINLNGCTISSTVPTTVAVNAPPSAPMPTSNTPVCEGDTIWLFPGATATTYTWTGPNGFFSTQDTAFVANSDLTDAGFYNLVTTIGGCISPVGQVEVDIVPTSFVPQISALSDTVCEGQILELQATGLAGVNAQYIWYGPSGVLDTTANPTYILSPITVADSGEYFVQTLIGSCMSLPSQVVLIDVNPTPATPDITFTSPVCEGEAIVVATNTVADAYNWTGPNGFNSELQNPDAILNASTLNAGNYTLSVTIDGCTSADSLVTVVVNPTPAAPLIFADSPICVGDSLIVYTNNVATDYLWTLPNMTTVLQANDSLIIVPSTLANAGNYGLQLVELGCASPIVFVNVDIQDSISSLPFAGFDFVVCDGQTVANLSAENNGQGFWSSPSNANIITPDSTQTIVTNLTQDSTYQFVWTLTNGICGNVGTDTIELYVAADPIANADSLIISAGNTALIDILINDSIPISSTFTIFQNPDFGTATIENNGISYTAGSNSTSDMFIYELCLDECPSMCDTALVNITIRPRINVPDLITPNGDGTNDAFVIEGIENFPENELVIFNRWGNEIFRAENYQNDWEGQFNNKDLPVGTYYYVFINLADGELIINGYITLQR